MLAQNPIPPILEPNTNQQQEIPQSTTQLLYRNLLRKITNSPLLKRFITLQNRSQSTIQSLCNGKLVSAKMRIKLINWLQKLTMETFQFSSQTLILAIQILDQYLSLTNISPQALQLTGCACLYLASKTRELTIVAGQCYVIAAGGCFSEDELMEKEQEVFMTLGFNTTFSSSHRLYKIISQTCNKGLDSYKREEVEKRFLDMAKNLELKEWKEHKVVCMFVAWIETHKELPEVSDVVRMLKLHSAF